MVSIEPESAIRRIFRVASILALIIVGFYVIGVGILYSEQRSMLFAGAGAPCPAWSSLPEGYRQVELRTSDELRLKALYRPASPGRTTLLFFHGNADSALTGVDLFAPLVAEGHGAMLVEFRGYCGNPGSPDERGLYRDGQAAARWLGERGVTSAKLIITGYSLGTGVAAKIATEAKPAGLILIAAYASMGQVASEHFPWVPARWLTKDQFPTIGRVRQVDAPILILHGADDSIVDPSNAIALSRARPEATLVMVAGEGHLIGFSDEAPRAIKAWIERQGL